LFLARRRCIHCGLGNSIYVGEIASRRIAVLIPGTKLMPVPAPPPSSTCEMPVRNPRVVRCGA